MPGNGRATAATLTEAGWTAAPGHVTAGRKLVFDPLTARQVDQVGAITGRIMARMHGRQGAGRPGVRSYAGSKARSTASANAAIEGNSRP